LLEELQSSTIHGGPVTLGIDARKEMLQVIDEESDRLNRFVEGLIELARIEAGELRLRRRWGVVDEIVATVLKRAEPLTRNHQVIVEIADEIPAVQVDPRAVAEVMFTLIDNAVKYSSAGTKILVSAHPVDDEIIQIAVEDEGQTIPRDIRERVFDKFFRATRDGDTGDSIQPKGTGMGLAVAKGIVEAHGGRIWIEDKREGVGTRAVFSLPISDAETPPGGSPDVVAGPAISREIN
jgi:two-component system sensor histidine kinase KdpD